MSVFTRNACASIATTTDKAFAYSEEVLDLVWFTELLSILLSPKTQPSTPRSMGQVQAVALQWTDQQQPGRGLGRYAASLEEYNSDLVSKQ